MYNKLFDMDQDGKLDWAEQALMIHEINEVCSPDNKTDQAVSQSYVPSKTGSPSTSVTKNPSGSAGPKLNEYTLSSKTDSKPSVYHENSGYIYGGISLCLLYMAVFWLFFRNSHSVIPFWIYIGSSAVTMGYCLIRFVINVTIVELQEMKEKNQKKKSS